jgi:hypothetical protein
MKTIRFPPSALQLLPSAYCRLPTESEGSSSWQGSSQVLQSTTRCHAGGERRNLGNFKK